MTQKMTEDMRIQEEIKDLNCDQLREYALRQEKKMREIINDSNNSLEKIRMSTRIYRKRALFAAKRLFENNPDKYTAYLKQLNEMTPRYLTKKEAEQEKLEHPDYYTGPQETPVSKYARRFAFLHRNTKSY